MFRLPQTAIYLNEEDIQQHLQRILLRHTLASSFGKLSLQDDKNGSRENEAVNSSFSASRSPSSSADLSRTNTSFKSDNSHTKRRPHIGRGFEHDNDSSRSGHSTGLEVSSRSPFVSLAEEVMELSVPENVLGRSVPFNHYGTTSGTVNYLARQQHSPNGLVQLAGEVAIPSHFSPQSDVKSNRLVLWRDGVQRPARTPRRQNLLLQANSRLSAPLAHCLGPVPVNRGGPPLHQMGENSRTGIKKTHPEPASNWKLCHTKDRDFAIDSKPPTPPTRSTVVQNHIQLAQLYQNSESPSRVRSTAPGPPAAHNSTGVECGSPVASESHDNPQESTGPTLNAVSPFNEPRLETTSIPGQTPCVDNSESLDSNGTEDHGTTMANLVAQPQDKNSCTGQGNHVSFGGDGTVDGRVRSSTASPSPSDAKVSDGSSMTMAIGVGSQEATSHRQERSSEHTADSVNSVPREHARGRQDDPTRTNQNQARNPTDTSRNDGTESMSDSDETQPDGQHGRQNPTPQRMREVAEASIVFREHCNRMIAELDKAG